MKTIRIVLALVLAVAATSLTGSCKTSDDKSAEMVSLCGGCGQVEGTEACCVADAPTCGSCELAKGSPGCCKMEKGKDAALCACGEVKGSDQCCAGEAMKCDDCGMAKDSPGCCST